MKLIAWILLVFIWLRKFTTKNQIEISFAGGSGHGGSSFSGYPSGASGAAVVQKHIYVHVPPPEPEEIIPQRAIPVAQAQKHYKIIFIKGMAIARISI